MRIVSLELATFRKSEKMDLRTQTSQRSVRRFVGLGRCVRSYRPSCDWLGGCCKGRWTENGTLSHQKKLPAKHTSPCALGWQGPLSTWQAASMPEQELLRVQKRPLHVFPGLAAVGFL